MTDEDKALVERLRDTAEQDATYGYEARGGLFDEAADRIEAQAAEIERLREALKHQGGPNTGWDDYRSVVYEASAALGETK